MLLTNKHKKIKITLIKPDDNQLRYKLLITSQNEYFTEAKNYSKYVCI